MLPSNNGSTVAHSPDKKEMPELKRMQDLVTIEALTAQEENAEADKLIGSRQNGAGGVANTRMCYMCFDDVDEAGNPLVRDLRSPLNVFNRPSFRGSLENARCFRLFGHECVMLRPCL